MSNYTCIVITSSQATPLVRKGVAWERGYMYMYTHELTVAAYTRHYQYVQVSQVHNHMCTLLALVYMYMYMYIPWLHSPAFFAVFCCFFTSCEKSWGVEPGNEATCVYTTCVYTSIHTCTGIH